MGILLQSKAKYQCLLKAPPYTTPSVTWVEWDSVLQVRLWGLIVQHGCMLNRPTVQYSQEFSGYENFWNVTEIPVKLLKSKQPFLSQHSAPLLEVSQEVEVNAKRTMGSVQRNDGRRSPLSGTDCLLGFRWAPQFFTKDNDRWAPRQAVMVAVGPYDTFTCIWLLAVYLLAVGAPPHLSLCLITPWIIATVMKVCGSDMDPIWLWIPTENFAF